MNSGGTVVLENGSGFLRGKTLTRSWWPAKSPHRPLQQGSEQGGPNHQGHLGLSRNLDTPGPRVWFLLISTLMRAFGRARWPWGE